MRNVHLAWSFLLLLVAGWPIAGTAQTVDELVNDHKTPQDVLVYGMGYNAQRYSPLQQINRATVKDLVPAWAYSMTDQTGLEAQPLVHNGIIYITNHNRTAAIDGVTGKEIWRHNLDYPPETLRVVCCGIVNRGAALLNGKLYRQTLDNFVMALDAKTGKEVWKTKSADPAGGYSMTGAPLIANGIVVVGVAGAEFGIRGFLEGYDAETGKPLWRRYTIPAKGEKGHDTWEGESAETGGGSTWVTGSYDPELDLVFWGIGNPAPWNPRGRKGDNLYTNGIMALKPKTGEVVWYVQTHPRDPFDYDGVNALVQADIRVGTETRKVVMQAHRNGFIYVLERATGGFIAVNPFVNVNWASGFDLATGRPVYSDVTTKAYEGEKVTAYPANYGATNWYPMSYSPEANLLYINTSDIGMEYQAPAPEKVEIGKRAVFVNIKHVFPENRGHLKAVDPLTGKAKWAVPFKQLNTAGTMVTAGGLVFTGQLTGEFIAVNAQDGAIVWKFQTPSGIIGQPITWEKDGVQYVTVGSGIGGVYAMRLAGPGIANIPTGSTLWTFKLHGK